MRIIIYCRSGNIDSNFTIIVVSIYQSCVCIMIVFEIQEEIFRNIRYIDFELIFVKKFRCFRFKNTKLLIGLLYPIKEIFSKISVRGNNGCTTNDHA